MSDNGKEMVEVTINGASVQAEPGRLLIDVAEEMGVFVPRFCYHPGMKPVAVCRMCLINIEGMPKLQPACATPVADGMVVTTSDEQSSDTQESMLEFLLINHPLDCPICDRAGECPLQDQTYKHGPGSSRYTEAKRTFEKALDISELVVLDRERCVLCWRCVRFSDEVAGDRFIQLVDRGDGTQILNFADDPFDSYFSGNTIQICPVGALTSKPYRFVSRPWDLETAPSVCDYCSVGCPITNESRAGNLVRRQALPNEQVNDFWMCDKGRFGYHHVTSNDRLELPLLRDDEEFKPASWPDATTAVASKLKDASKVGVIAGGHLTTEDAYAISKLAKGVIGTADVDSRIQDSGAPYEKVAERFGVAGSTATISDLKAAKTVVWVGPDPKEVLPVLYLHLHTGARDREQKLLVVANRTLSIDAFAARTWRPGAGKEAMSVADVRPDIEGDAVFCWAPSSLGRDESASLTAVLDLASEFGGKVLICPPHAGSQGMIDMGVHPALDAGYQPVAEPGRDTRAILEAAAAGELDALIVFGADLISDFPDADLARRALSGKTFTVVVELFPTETARHADVVLPSAASPEVEGTFTNLERRLQKLEPLMSPLGASREIWKTCQAIARALDADWSWRNVTDIWADIKREVPTHAEVDIDALSQEAPAPQPFDTSGFGAEVPQPLRLAGPGGQYPKGHRQGAPFQTGQNWPLSWELRAFEARQRPGSIPPAPEGSTPQGSAPQGSAEPPESSGSKDRSPAAGEATGDGTRFALLTGRMIYDEGNMVSRSKALQALQRKPFIEINDADAKELGVTDGDSVVVSGAGVEVTLSAVVNGIARGSVFVPYDQDGLRANTLISGIDPVVAVRKP